MLEQFKTLPWYLKGLIGIIAVIILFGLGYIFGYFVGEFIF